MAENWSVGDGFPGSTNLDTVDIAEGLERLGERSTPGLTELLPHPSMSTTWNPETWIEQGAKCIQADALAAQRMISNGLKIKPDCGIGWFNLGIAKHQQGKIKGAIRCYRKALALNGSEQLRISATTNLSQDLLLNGEWSEGFKLYEERFLRGKTDFTTYIKLFGEPWEGWSDPRPCQELVVVGEQGYGDTLQFVRLIQLIKDKGLKTRYFGPESLRLLLENGSRLGPFPAMLDGHQSEATLWCPLMSLPNRLNLQPDNIPLSKGYLKADPRRLDYWSRTLKHSTKKRLIALHWQGNPEFERSLYNQGRSMTLEALSPLGDLDDIEFLCIQKGAAAKEIEKQSHLSWVDGQQEFSNTMDFQDTAAALKCCDLLISADSAVVHLAGALGVPTWVALSKVPEWRWGLKSERTNWYKNTLLFRQPEANNWKSVIEKMREALK